MTQWGVYLVVASLLSTAALLAKPLAALTRINTRLECAVDKLNETMRRFENRMEQMEQSNRAAHGKLWQRLAEQREHLRRLDQAAACQTAVLRHAQKEQKKEERGR